MHWCLTPAQQDTKACTMTELRVLLCATGQVGNDNKILSLLPAEPCMRLSSFKDTQLQELAFGLLTRAQGPEATAQQGTRLYKNR